ncbi:MAG: PAC2 family protein [Nanoarchaeota archaeon]|nr:PAC2 family protein [Nanoarchaeota archaeon]MBU0963313.1 PAC2 family protein [Nanoarchaeota archaeon]
MPWTLKTIKKINSKKSILIEGLPGMGNVGKIAVDFIIDDLKAEKVFDVLSPKLPNCVFVNEDNLIELPSISVYYKKVKDKSIFLISGDTQPLDETSCYEFCNEVLKLCKKYNCKEIITLGGVGMQKEPAKPKVYFSGNGKEIIKRYNHSKNLNGLVGPIVGVSGLLVGLANNVNIPAVNIMAETFGHPNHMGLKGAKEILNILETKLKLGLDLKKLNKEINKLQKDMFNIEDINENINMEDIEDLNDIQEKPEDKWDKSYMG